MLTAEVDGMDWELAGNFTVEANFTEGCLGFGPLEALSWPEDAVA